MIAIALEQRCDLGGGGKAAITVGEPPSQDARRAMLRFCDARVRTHCCVYCRRCTSRVPCSTCLGCPASSYPFPRRALLEALLPLGLPATSRLWMEEVTTGAWHLQSSFARLCYPARLPGLPPMLRQPGRGAAPQGPPRGAPGDGDAWSGGRRRLPTRCPGRLQPTSSLDAQRPPDLGLRSCAAPPGLVGRTATRTPAAPAAAACTVPAAAGGSREGFVPGGQGSPFPLPGGARATTACCQPSGGDADAEVPTGGARVCSRRLLCGAARAVPVPEGVPDEVVPAHRPHWSWTWRSSWRRPSGGCIAHPRQPQCRRRASAVLGRYPPMQGPAPRPRPRLACEPGRRRPAPPTGLSVPWQRRRNNTLWRQFCLMSSWRRARPP